VPQQSNHNRTDSAIYASQFAYQLLNMSTSDTFIEALANGKIEFNWQWSAADVIEERSQLLELFKERKRQSMCSRGSIINDNDEDSLRN